MQIKRLLTLVISLFITICMGIPAYAEENTPRRLDV